MARIVAKSCKDDPLLTVGFNLRSGKTHRTRIPLGMHPLCDFVIKPSCAFVKNPLCAFVVDSFYHKGTQRFHKGTQRIDIRVFSE
ncbi:MAG: hypothetical protein FWH18_12330 [Marinilabiliaceae bacterium]|nr:hypothetical protein [Marinilabiliaceae bacterium]